MNTTSMLLKGTERQHTGSCEGGQISWKQSYVCIRRSPTINTHYRVDLVFYHRILRCFVLIDLKINDVQHQDIGQMNLYLGYFATEENEEADNPPIGIILTRHKDELLVEYATYQMNSQLFVQKYQLFLPEREELRRELEMTLRLAETRARTDAPSNTAEPEKEN